MEAVERVVQELHGFAGICSEAVRKLEERSRGGEKRLDPKTLVKPDVWHPQTVDEEQSGWPEWSFLFKSYLTFMEDEYKVNFETVEQDIDRELKLVEYTDEMRERAKKLYAYLVSFLKGRPLRVVRAILDGDGFRAWQQLCREFQPQTIQRELGLIQALVAYPVFEKGKIMESVMKYERLVSDYERLAGSSLDENLKIATLIRCCPNQLRQHLQLNVKPGMKYEQIRQSMVAYEQTTTSWSAQKILEYSEVQPMEVDRVKGDGKGKGKKGKGKSKGSKGKGSKGDKGKGKGSYKGDSKGKGKGGGKGKSDTKGQGKGKGPCFICNKMGHKAADCWQRHERVQQVENGQQKGGASESPSTTATTLPSSASSTITSTSARTAGSVRRIRMLTPPKMTTCEIFDLAEESDLENTFDLEVRMITSEGSSVEVFNMAQTDEDNDWTTCGDYIMDDYIMEDTD